MIDSLRNIWSKDKRLEHSLKMSSIAKETDFKEKISKSTKEALSRKDIKQKMSNSARERVKQTRWYTNGITPKKINLKDVDKYLNLGHKPGRQLWLS